MLNQKSLLSFFSKSQTIEEGHKGAACHSKEESVDVMEIETPPEKVPRKVLPGCHPRSIKDSGGSLFSNIQHKFMKVDSKKATPDQGKINVRYDDSQESLRQKSALTPIPFGKFSTHSIRQLSEVENEDSRLKRARERDLGEISSLLKGNKREKLLQEPVASIRNPGAESEQSCKFEWLDPSKIRDGSRRRPDDPLYDSTTLYIPSDALKKMSASQKQYWSVKSQYMDIVLFFKVGKFYELYELDAEIGHKELDWKMTLSGVGKCRQVGISESGIDDAVEKLVARGYKVGRIEQLETSDQMKARGGSSSVIARKLVQVVTPSTTMSDNIGPHAVHLLAIKEINYQIENGETTYGFAFVDCSSLQFWVGSINDNTTCSALGALLVQISPREITYDNSGLSKETIRALKKYSFNGSSAVQLTGVQPAIPLHNASDIRNIIQANNYFSKCSKPWSHALDGIKHPDAALTALGALINHLNRLKLDDSLRSGNVSPYHVYMGCLRIDGQTFINLEIFNNNADGGSAGTLIKYLDQCLTPSGKRLLRKWICHPLKHVDAINDRLNVVEAFINRPEITSFIEQHLRKLPDLERTLGRLRIANDASSLLLVPLIGKKILKQRVKAFGVLVKGLRCSLNCLARLVGEDDMCNLLLRVFNLPELGGEAGLCNHLAKIEAAVDSEFPNFQNQDLAEAQTPTLAALIDAFLERIADWCDVIQAIGIIDVLRSFAVIASTSPAVVCKPVLLPASKRSVLKMKGLWHPFAFGENNEPPVPNDVVLGDDNCPLSLLLTGPNMGGKSTLLRASCLAVILAQLGCFVPCETCVLSLVDVIFTRLGATDRIMTGESTFLVECSETAAVLQRATGDSLVILDELGRGTSTFDGYAIAYSVFRHLVETTKCRLLFATHYHPLTKEFASHPRVAMRHMTCSLTADRLVFLYRLGRGPSPESYGLRVASIAGIPEKVISAASDAGDILKKSMRKCFESSERRSEFSSLHEEWVKAVLSIRHGCLDADTLLCLWHEIRHSYHYCH